MSFLDSLALPVAHSLRSSALSDPERPRPGASERAAELSLDLARDLLGGALSVLAPTSCLACREPLPDLAPSFARPSWPGDLCAGCLEELAWIDASCLGCGRGRGPGLPSCARCPSCLGRARGRVRETVALWRYRGPGRTLIRRLKYESLASLGPPLGELLAERVQDVFPDLPHTTLVVPVPLHPLRRFLRGYNQAHEVARGLSEALELELGEPLRRVRYTRALYGVPRERRAQALRGAFALRRGAEALADRPILLVDDVRTSGATLRAAARALRLAGAGVTRAAVLAR